MGFLGGIMGIRGWWAIAVFVFLGMPQAWVLRADQVGEPLAILQGLTDQSRSQFVVVVRREEVLKYQVRHLGPLRVSVRVQRVAQEFSEWAVDRVYVDGLSLGSDYELRVLDRFDQVRDQRLFKALDVDSKSVTFALASCVNDHYEATATWVQLSKDRPDLLLMVGDSVYADHIDLVTRRTADPEQLWNRYVETWNDVALFRFKRLIPTLATWDDHDYGMNDGDRNFQYQKESLQILNTFFAQDSRASKILKPGPGAAAAFRAFGQNFLLLDARSFRTEKGASTSTHWGVDQENWIVQQAKAAPVPTWILNGSQFFGAYHGKESVEGQHLESLKRLGRNLIKLPQVFAFGSGDVHFSEVMDIESSFLGYPTIEITSSSINGWYIRWMDRVLNNPRRQNSVADHNYVLVNSKVTAAGGLDVRAVSRSASNTENFRVERRIERRID